MYDGEQALCGDDQRVQSRHCDVDYPLFKRMYSMYIRRFERIECSN